MRNNLSLNLIYRYENIETESGVNSVYRVVYFFSEAGFIDNEVVKNVYKTLGLSFDEIIFENLDQLGEFALKVCVELQSPEVFVLSVQDYNTGMDSVRDIRNFREVFRRFGNCLTNPEQPFEKQSLFGSIFKK